MAHKTITEFVDQLQQRARYSFTREEAERSIETNRAALTKGLQRLQHAGRIQKIRRGFYVIVPIEYRTGGMVPPDWFVDDLMKYLGCQYYVGILSAAALFGASHQQAQEYHIITTRPLRAIRLVNMNVRFFLKRSATDTPTTSIKGYTGSFPVSTAAATALDLVRFAHDIGGLDTVLTVLDELVDEIIPEDLVHAADREPDLSIVQRAGWLLEQTKRRPVTVDLAEWLSEKHPSKTRLDVRAPLIGSKKDPRWQVIVNADPQSDV
ncbi:type IV toxin-antitoxin system AbiEi family antitoxin [bacterium]|nr:type IV toxin-antitoxin system AbiEi family antitoxin [bacterium]